MTELALAYPKPERGKFSPVQEAQDLFEGDWDDLKALQTETVEVIGLCFDEGFTAGAIAERKRATDAANPVPVKGKKEKK